MATVPPPPVPPAEEVGAPLTPAMENATVAAAGRRRRPSGEPPPLPRDFPASTRWHVAAGAAVFGLWVGLQFQPVLVAVTRGDDAVLRVIAHGRVQPLTSIMGVVFQLGSNWTIRVAAWVTIALLAGVRRHQHLAVYVGILLAGSWISVTIAAQIGRMRPTVLPALAAWQGYAHPSRPVVGLALVLVGAVYTLAPSGPWRGRAKWASAAVLGALILARLYLGLDHPTDVLAALALGWSIPTVLYRWLAPEEAFPVSYHPGQRAHLDIGGRRGTAIAVALDHQLGLELVSAEPFGQRGSAGSTPLRLRVRARGDGPGRAVFAKIYATSHLRSDRWYKLARTVRYGRLEDEATFASVRRLVEYEDHLLRLFRDAGLPTPAPLGLVEITPEREYLLLMEFAEGAREIGESAVTDEEIDDGLRIVRRMWDAGVAHRDIKPSNLLVREGRVVLIDVAFGTVRPSPWRQAVDLADMMLTLALTSTPEHVYDRALRVFTPDEVAEAFAACRSVTVPAQLKSCLHADGRDLIARFRALAPTRRPVAIQRWSVRRVAMTLEAVGGAALLAWVLFVYARSAALL